MLNLTKNYKMLF